MNSWKLTLTRIFKGILEKKKTTIAKEFLEKLLHESHEELLAVVPGVSHNLRYTVTNLPDEYQKEILK